MKYLTVAALVSVAFWAGMAVEAAAKPLPPVYIVKADPPRCDLIDRVTRKKGQHL